MQQPNLFTTLKILMKNSTTTTTILDSHNDYGAAVFQQVLEKYSSKVQTILSNEKTLTVNLDSPANLPHSYNDKFTIAEQFDMKIIAKAMKSDLRAYQEILDRLEGRAKQTTDINANIQGSVQIVIQEDDRCKPIED